MYIRTPVRSATMFRFWLAKAIGKTSVHVCVHARALSPLRGYLLLFKLHDKGLALSTCRNLTINGLMTAMQDLEVKFTLLNPITEQVMIELFMQAGGGFV